MKTYEKPEFVFRELKLFERVADTCWGTATVWLDTDRDGKITPGLDINLTTSGGCKGKDSSVVLNSEVDRFNAMVSASNHGQNLDVVAAYSPALKDYLVAHPDVTLNSVEAKAVSSDANTKAVGDGFVYGQS